MFDPTQNAADPNGGINSQPQNGDDSGAPPQSAPASPQNGQPQPAQTQNPPPGQPAANLPPGQFMKNLSHSFIGSVLGAIAGRPEQRYVVDASGKTVPDPNQRVNTGGDKIKRIAANALQGLAAGASVPPQKSKAAALAAGLGAGAQAQTQSADAKDALNRKNAGEDYERQQQQILRRHDIAKGNLINLTTMQHVNQEALDHDPERQKNLEIAKAAEEEGIGVRYLSETDAMRLYKQDPKTLVAEHILLPGGMKAVTDSDGKQVYDDADGNPKFEGQVIAIDGMHDGSFTPPASFYENVKKHGKFGGMSDTDSLEAGQPMTMENFARAHTAVRDGQKQELSGWAKPEAVFGGADGKTPMQRNSVTGELREYPKGVVPNIKNEVAESGAKAAKDLADAGKADKAGSVTDEDRFKENQENYRAQLAKTATKGTELQKQGVASLQKQSDAYSQFATTAASLKSSLAAAKNGNELAAAVAPLQGTLFITTAEGVKRINETELKGVSGAGSLVQRINGALSKTKGGGPLSDSLKDDMAKLVDIYTDSKYSGYEKQAKYTQKLHGLDPTTTPILDRDGNIVMTDDSSSQSGQAAKGGQGGGKTAQNAPPQPTGHKVGDQIKQNGKVLTVTAVDANGKVTGAK